MMRTLAFLLLFASCLAPSQARAGNVVEEELRLDAPGLSEVPIRVRIYLSPGYDAGDARYPVLYVNDGQDMRAVGMRDTLQQSWAEAAIRPLIVAAIDMPPDRMAGYGLFDRASGSALVAHTRHGDIGANAQRYAAWLVGTLVPALDARYRTRADADGRALLGWSLGAASAFGIAWQYPEVFGRVGAFSPSFWLSSERGDAAAVQRTRLAQGMVEAGRADPRRRQRTRWWIAVGDHEETDDRDGDGVNDAVDDARDLALALQRDGGADLDWSLRPERREPVAFALVAGGEHNPAAWKRMLPEFLRWAYGRAPLAAPSPLARTPGD